MRSPDDFNQARAGKDFRPMHVIGPLGEPLALSDLPPHDIKRWYPRQKAELVAAVEGGLLTVDEVCATYRIDLEEFVSWQRGMDRLGMRGLFVTRSKMFRDRYGKFYDY